RHHAFFLNDTPATYIYPLSLHDALPIYAESFAMGKQRDLLDLPPVAVDLAADRVADFVCGDDRALALVHRPPSGRADGDLEPAGVQILGVDRVGRTARREDGRFVEHVSQLGSREAVRLA